MAIECDCSVWRKRGHVPGCIVPRFATLDLRLDALRADAQALGAEAIRAKLGELQARFKRHRFAFRQAMGTEFVSITPRLPGIAGTGETQLDRTDCEMLNGRAHPAVGWRLSLGRLWISPNMSARLMPLMPISATL